MRKTFVLNYLLAILFIICGIYCGYYFITNSTDKNDKTTQKFTIPGRNEIQLLNKNYTVFHEYESDFNGKTYKNDEQTLTDVIIELKNIETSDRIELIANNNRKEYKSGTNKGTAIYNFTIITPGKYELITENLANNEPDQAVLTIREANSSSNTQSILKISLGIGIPTIAIIIALIIIVSTNKNKKSPDTNLLMN